MKEMFEPGISRKLQKKWRRLFEVLAMIRDVAFQLKDLFSGKLLIDPQTKSNLLFAVMRFSLAIAFTMEM